MPEKSFNHIKPLFRPREMILADRNNMKGQKHSWWKVKDKYNAVMFVPPTPGSVLLKMLRARTEKISAEPDLKIRFIEQGSVKIKNLLVKANPFPQLTAQMPFVPFVKRQVYLNQGTNQHLELLVQQKELAIELFVCIAENRVSFHLMKVKLGDQPRLDSLSISRC